MMNWYSINDIQQINEFIEKVCPRAIRLDGFDSCIIGLQLNKDKSTRIIYSFYALVTKLVNDHNIDYFNAQQVIKDSIKNSSEFVSNLDLIKYDPLIKDDLPNPSLN